MDVNHLTLLWRRIGWLGYFFTMSFALILLLIFTSRLDYILAMRSDLSLPPTSSAILPEPNTSLSIGRGNRSSALKTIQSFFVAIRSAWQRILSFVTGHLEHWSAPKDDKQVAWTLGIGWACCGGGLAGGCLVFAKAT